MRTKTVFAYDDLIHRWANGLANVGDRSKSRNVSLNHDASAIRHWNTDIAQRLKHKGEVWFVVDNARFSVTTSQIQHQIRRFIRDGSKVFLLELGSYNQRLDFTPKAVVNHFIREFGYSVENHPQARIRAERFLAKVAWLDKAIDACIYFGLAHKKLVNQRNKLQPQVEQAQQVIADAAKRRAELAETADARAKVRNAKVIAKAIEVASDDNLLRECKDLTFGKKTGRRWRWRSQPEFPHLDGREDLKQRVRDEIARREANRVTDWLAGVPNVKAPEALTLLRVNGTDVETSKGARVPVDAAERTFRFVWALREKGWHRNGETHEVGGYQLEAVNEQGLVIGCHRIVWAEVERFARSQGWLNVSG